MYQFLTSYSFFLLFLQFLAAAIREIENDLYGGNVYIIMELADINVADLLKSKKLMSEVRVADIMRQMLARVDYFHSTDIIHRDIKGNNKYLYLFHLFSFCNILIQILMLQGQRFYDRQSG